MLLPHNNTDSHDNTAFHHIDVTEQHCQSSSLYTLMSQNTLANFHHIDVTEQHCKLSSSDTAFSHTGVTVMSQIETSITLMSQNNHHNQILLSIKLVSQNNNGNHQLLLSITQMSQNNTGYHHHHQLLLFITLMAQKNAGNHQHHQICLPSH